MRRHFHFVTYSLIFIFCLIRAEPTPGVNAVAAGQAGTSDAKVVSQQQPFLQAAAPVSAESLLQKIEETFRGTSGACLYLWCYIVCPYSLLFFMLERSSSPRPL